MLHKMSPPVPATFRNGTAQALQNFFAQYVNGQAGATPLVMRLTNLEVAETLGATASVIADLYTPQPDSSYRLVLHYAQTLTQATGLFGNATAKLGPTLSALLLDAALLSRDRAHWLPRSEAYPAAYVLAPEVHPAEMLPVLAPDVQPRAGFYGSLPEFWYNQPSQPGQPEVESHPYTTTEWAGDAEVKPYRRTATGQRVPATDAWGFSDGKDFYLHQGTNFYKLARLGQGFAFHGRIGDDPVYQAMEAINNNKFGGGLVGYGLSSATGPSPERRALFSFSPLTGSVSLDQGAIAPPLATRPTHLFVYRPRNAKGPAVRIRLANDEPAQELNAGDYLDFMPSADQQVQVCLLPATGPAVLLPIVPTAEAPTYLECRPNEPLPLRQVEGNTGAAALTRLVR